MGGRVAAHEARAGRRCRPAGRGRIDKAAEGDMLERWEERRLTC